MTLANRKRWTERCRAAALAGYLGVSIPVRVSVRWWLAAKHMAPVVVFFYHRIADDRRTPWSTSSQAFRRQIRLLKRLCRVVPLSEAHRVLVSGKNTRTLAVVTFDDGYADNFRNALPVILEEEIPVTYFVTVENIRSGKPFAHDLPYGEPAAPNTIDEIRAMAASGIEIGSHAWTHADFGHLFDPHRIRHELVDSKRALEDLLGREVRYFAFPFGCHENLSKRAFALAEEAGYQAVCTAYGGYNLPGDDPFNIQRFHGDESLLRLIHRATIDPRLLRVPRYEYALPVPAPLCAACDTPYRRPCDEPTPEEADPGRSESLEEAKCLEEAADGVT
ncbi:polysaccharide deacetylase family protein [Thermostilla marina]